VCHGQLAQLREKISAIRDAGAELLAIDPHEHWASKSLLKETGFGVADVNFPLLSDPSLTVSATYGVPFQMRIHTEWSNRPATFIIDRSGVVRFAQRAKSFNDRPSVDRILDELRSL
jgi:peroxiredoxin